MPRDLVWVKSTGRTPQWVKTRITIKAKAGYFYTHKVRGKRFYPNEAGWEPQEADYAWVLAKISKSFLYFQKQGDTYVTALTINGTTMPLEGTLRGLLAQILSLREVDPKINDVINTPLNEGFRDKQPQLVTVVSEAGRAALDLNLRDLDKEAPVLVVEPNAYVPEGETEPVFIANARLDDAVAVE